MTTIGSVEKSISEFALMNRRILAVSFSWANDRCVNEVWSQSLVHTDREE
jgi:hypothetical protein